MAPTPGSREDLGVPSSFGRGVIVVRKYWIMRKVAPWVKKVAVWSRPARDGFCLLAIFGGKDALWVRVWGGIGWLVMVDLGRSSVGRVLTDPGRGSTPQHNPAHIPPTPCGILGVGHPSTGVLSAAVGSQDGCRAHGMGEVGERASRLILGGF